MNTSACNCHTETSKTNVNERPRYYPRQLVTPDDMTLEQDYFRAKLRRHNRYLHGWGVVCGAEVVAANKPWKVIVKAGYILGPYGDEIFIATDQCIDVTRKCTPAETPGDECLEAPPPPPPSDEPRFIAIRYVENKSRLIRVPLGGCGCEENTCEYSRLTDGYEICVIDYCPDSHKGATYGEVRRSVPDCPECEIDPWVILASFSINKEDNTVQIEETNWRPTAPANVYRAPCLALVRDREPVGDIKPVPEKKPPAGGEKPSPPPPPPPPPVTDKSKTPAGKP
jgi:hypothetical protein